MKRIIFPGWGVPIELYLPFLPDEIIDFGFFPDAAADFSVKKVDANPADFNDTFLKTVMDDEPSVVIAHSLGALPALRSSQLSDSIKAIVLIGGFARFTESLPEYPDGKPVSGISMMQNMMKLSPKMVLDKFYQAMVTPSAFSITPSGKANSANLIKGLSYLVETDLRVNLKDIKVPVLILHGAGDQIVSPKLAEFLRDNITGSELHIFENAGHALPFTHPEQCLTLIDEFIK